MSASKLLPKLPTSVSFLPNRKANPDKLFSSINLSNPKVNASVLISFDDEMLLSPVLPRDMLPSLQ